MAIKAISQSNSLNVMFFFVCIALMFKKGSKLVYCTAISISNHRNNKVCTEKSN